MTDVELKEGGRVPPVNPLILAEPGEAVIEAALSLAQQYIDKCKTEGQVCLVGNLVASYAPKVAELMHRRLREELSGLEVERLSDKLATETGADYLVVVDRRRELSRRTRVEIAVRAIALAAAGLAITQKPAGS